MFKGISWYYDSLLGIRFLQYLLFIYCNHFKRSKQFFLDFFGIRLFPIPLIVIGDHLGSVRHFKGYLSLGTKKFSCITGLWLWIPSNVDSQLGIPLDIRYPDRKFLDIGTFYSDLVWTTIRWKEIFRHFRVFSHLNIKYFLQFYEEFFHSSSGTPFQWLMAIYIPMVLFNFLRTLKFIAWLSTIGNFCMVSSLAFLLQVYSKNFFEFFWNLFQYVIRYPIHSIGEMPFFNTFDGLLTAAGSIIYSFEAQTLVLIIKQFLNGYATLAARHLRFWSLICSLYSSRDNANIK